MLVSKETVVGRCWASETLRLCSIGINCFSLVGLINFFHQTEARLKWLKMFLCFNQKRLEKCSIGEHQHFQPKLVIVVKTVDLKRTRPKILSPAETLALGTEVWQNGEASFT